MPFPLPMPMPFGKNLTMPLQSPLPLPLPLPLPIADCHYHKVKTWHYHSNCQYQCHYRYHSVETWKIPVCVALIKNTKWGRLGCANAVAATGCQLQRETNAATWSNTFHIGRVWTVMASVNSSASALYPLSWTGYAGTFVNFCDWIVIQVHRVVQSAMTTLQKL